jgi:hypothetical protein
MEAVEQMEVEIQQAAHWFASGDTGVSSERIVTCAMANTLVPSSWDEGYPRDPADIGRCFRAIDKMPWARRGLDILAGTLPRWRALAARWDEIRQVMNDEVGIDWSRGKSAPKTYGLMEEIIDGATKG